LKADLKRGPTAKAAIGDLPDADEFDLLNQTDSVAGAKFAKPSDYAAELRCLTNEAWHFGYVRNWNPAVLTSSARTGHTEISKRRFSTTRGGQTEPISRFYKLAPDGLSNTLRAGTDGARGAFTSPRPIHYKYDRCVTVREMARLHGYPDWFRFHETKWHGARQIGNSVPPPLARAVAAEVMVALGREPVRPKLSIDLGSPILLRHTVSEAAMKFDVPAPPSKRDRKSGARKRKQHEIEAELQARRQVANG
jgi:DNA (cytosine-5)-methyltransferase 1